MAFGAADALRLRKRSTLLKRKSGRSTWKLEWKVGKPWWKIHYKWRFDGGNQQQYWGVLKVMGNLQVTMIVSIQKNKWSNRLDDFGWFWGTMGTPILTWDSADFAIGCIQLTFLTPNHHRSPPASINRTSSHLKHKLKPSWLNKQPLERVSC